MLCRLRERKFERMEEYFPVEVSFQMTHFVHRSQWNHLKSTLKLYIFYKVYSILKYYIYYKNINKNVKRLFEWNIMKITF
jgi:hypothetical protein